LAATEGFSEAVAFLLARGANANVQEALGNTPLMEAILHKHTRCAELLLPHSDLSLTNKQGRNAFHICVQTASEECFKLLLPRVADVDVRTVARLRADGDAADACFTALHIACTRGQNKMAKELLKRGASRTARDSKQRTALHYCAIFGQLSCLVAVLGHPGDYKMTPADVSAVGELGWTPLHCAADEGNIQCCGALIGGGAQLDAHSNDGETPLMVAQRNHPTNAELHALLAGQGPALAPGTVCDHCGCPEEASRHLKNCDGCRAARYCGVACQTAAWPAHKEECRRRKAQREDSTSVNIVQ
jgi:ankyrin repeat protein